MDQETYDDLLSQIQAGKVIQYAGRSAYDVAGLEDIRAACQPKGDGEPSTAIPDDPLAELKARASALGIDPLPDTEKGLRKAIEVASNAARDAMQVAGV